jgi:hypothetical protein
MATSGQAIMGAGNDHAPTRSAMPKAERVTSSTRCVQDTPEHVRKFGPKHVIHRLESPRDSSRIEGAIFEKQERERFVVQSVGEVCRLTNR